MSSMEKSMGKTKTPAFRFRGLTILLVCTLVVNVILVTVATVMRPDNANAHTRQAADKSMNAPGDESADTPVQVADNSENGENAVDLVEPTVVRPVDSGDEANHTASENPTLVVETSPQPEIPSTEPSGALVMTEPTEGVDLSLENVVETQPIEPVTPGIPLVQPEPAVTTPVPRPRLIVVNPAHNGGVVAYLVDGKIHSLAPGQEHDLGNGPPRRIEFHRGDSFGEATVLLDAGTYHFDIGDEGWSLTQTTSIVD